jgi:hypothetical protein
MRRAKMLVVAIIAAIACRYKCLCCPLDSPGLRGCEALLN